MRIGAEECGDSWFEICELLGRGAGSAVVGNGREVGNSPVRVSHGGKLTRQKHTVEVEAIFCHTTCAYV